MRVAEYVGWTRDEETWKSFIKEKFISLPGKRGIVVGERHRQRMRRYITGEKISSPPDWEGFLRNLPLNERELVKKLQQEFLPVYL